VTFFPLTKRAATIRNLGGSYRAEKHAYVSLPALPFICRLSIRQSLDRRDISGSYYSSSYFSLILLSTFYYLIEQPNRGIFGFSILRREYHMSLQFHIRRVRSLRMGTQETFKIL
jgi:hypothetical protein